MFNDATRISDGTQVMLKIIKPSLHPHEVKIGTLFSSEPLVSDPKNHCVPIYDVLTVPDIDDRVILVMPLLRQFDDPPFQTIGETVDLFSQLLEVCIRLFGCRCELRLTESRALNSCTDNASLIGEFIVSHRVLSY